MKVSLKWVRHINDKYKCAADPAPKGVDDLVDKIGAQLGAVDEVIDLGKKYEGALVVKVADCIKHPNADKLSVCLVDDNKKTKGIDRNKEGLIQVVCGAPKCLRLKRPYNRHRKQDVHSPAGSFWDAWNSSRNCRYSTKLL
jgi:hypothetical protein